MLFMYVRKTMAKSNRLKLLSESCNDLYVQMPLDNVVIGSVSAGIVHYLEVFLRLLVLLVQVHNRNYGRPVPSTRQRRNDTI